MVDERRHLHDAIDMVEPEQLDILYRIVCQFIPEDIPYPDEIEAIQKGQEEIARGEYIRFEDLD